MDSQTVFAKLRDVLAHLYPTTESARRLADDAGLDARRIRFSAQALENWHAILGAAVQADKLAALLHIAVAEYDNNRDLLAAYGMYRHFIEQGGRIAPPEAVYGNQGDNAAIAVQIVIGAKNVSLGPNISQTTIEGNVSTGGGDVVGRDKTTNIFNYLFGSTPEAGQYIRARKILLENVNKFWVEGVLKRSLHNEVLLTLDLEDRPSTVDNRPWDMVLQTPQQPNRSLPPGTKIIDVFDQQHQSLLILGMPGSGKTTILLELASSLIKRAQEDVSQPIPVVLNLSSWAAHQQPLADWIAAEFTSKYYIVPKVTKTWMQHDALLLLLDGLDEVQLAQRNACVAAINAFRKTYSIALAVCCRIVDYEALEQQLQLHGAVLLQPLSSEQIDGYFVRLGAECAAIRATLRQDPILQELAESPLMLSIMTLAYQGIAIVTGETQRSVLAYRQHLFDTYIRRMFARREPPQLYQPQQILHWLLWLATNMFQRQQTIFLVEQLQPDWLQMRSHIRLYRLLVGVVVGGLASWGAD
jgi:hypothetical protein